ncbi:MAG: NADH-quinone oxidoreductase subunit NuoG, partial [Desulfobacula sp.]
AEGTKVIEAAERLGIFIPRFCYHPALGSVGACRVCAVKFLEGPVKGIEMSCMVEARDGMKISTTDPDTVAFRKYVIECLMRNHPHDCPVCDEGGHCLLQEMTIAGGHGIRQYQGPKRTYPDQDLGPLIQHEMNRCIQCYRCTRYYREITGYKDLGVMGIAGRIYYGRFEQGRLESPFSGNLIDICPTGVYTDKPSRYSGRRWDFERSPGICIHCSLGCNTTVSARYRAIVRQEARFNPAVNGYFICDRGRYGFQYANLPERPREGRPRQGRPRQGKPRQGSANGETAAANEAVEAAAAAIAGIENRFGASSIGVIGSGRSSLETLAMLCHACRTKGWQPPGFWPKALGDAIHTAISVLSPDLAVSMGEIESADFIFMVGADPLNEAPMMAMALRQAHLKNSIIWAADPRPLDLSFPFEQISCSPADMTGLLQKIMDQLDHPKESQSQEIKTLAEGLLISNRPLILCGTEVPDAAVIAQTAELARVLKTRKALAGLFFIFPQANTYGAALLFEDHQPLESILDKIEENEIKAVIFLESDAFEQFPDRRRLEGALQKLELIVTIDCLDNPLHRMAHIKVPTQSIFEAGGIYVNSEGRPQYSHIAHNGGLPISQTGQGSHPPRTFQKQIPGADMPPAWKAIQDISRAKPEDLVAGDIITWTEKNFPVLSGILHLHDRDVRLHAKNRTCLPFPKPEPLSFKKGFEILAVASVFGDEPLSSLSPCLEDLGKKEICISRIDARNLGIDQGDKIILDLPHAPLEFTARLSGRTAPGILIIPRQHDMPWQQFDAQGRLFVDQPSIRIIKKE